MKLKIIVFFICQLITAIFFCYGAWCLMDFVPRWAHFFYIIIFIAIAIYEVLLTLYLMDIDIFKRTK